MLLFSELDVVFYHALKTVFFLFTYYLNTILDILLHNKDCNVQISQTTCTYIKYSDYLYQTANNLSKNYCLFC